MLPTRPEWKATAKWTTPARTMSQERTTLTATAAIIGEATASTPRRMRQTPQTVENLEACRTTSDGLACAIRPPQQTHEVYSSRREQSIGRGQRTRWNLGWGNVIR